MELSVVAPPLHILRKVATFIPVPVIEQLTSDDQTIASNLSNRLL